MSQLPKRNNNQIPVSFSKLKGINVNTFPNKSREEKRLFCRPHIKMFGDRKSSTYYGNDFDNIERVIVFDLDDTLIFYDVEKVICTTQLIYLRPYALDCLQLCNDFENTLVICWSLGYAEYVHEAIHTCNLSKYFFCILTRDDSKISQENYGCQKSFRYIEKLLNLNSVSSILIDDKAFENTEDVSSYTYLIQPKPFDADVVYKQTVKGVFFDSSMQYVLNKLLEFKIKTI